LCINRRPRSRRPPSTTWPRWAAENYCTVGPAGTGKSHSLVAFGVAAVEAGHRVRYFTAAELVETLYRGLADNSVGRVIETILRADLVIIHEVGFAPLDDTGDRIPGHSARIRRRPMRPSAASMWTTTGRWTSTSWRTRSVGRYDIGTLDVSLLGAKAPAALPELPRH
jgi:hypothetical protein